MPSKDEEAEAKKDLLSFISIAQEEGTTYFGCISSSSMLSLVVMLPWLFVADSNLRAKVKNGNTSPVHKLPPVRGFELPSAEERHLADATAQAKRINGKVVDLRESTKEKAKKKQQAKRETYYSDETEELAADDRFAHLTPEARRAMSVREKEKGNDCYRAKEFEDAIEFYTQSIRLAGPRAPVASVLHTNRAMAWMKLEHFDRAEQDCNRVRVNIYISFFFFFSSCCFICVGDLLP